ncbi:MAG TPA: helix-turn-helix domain-containing protein [Bacteroidia bacterium]|jgi:DNA-binding HxlR family transcriptional regulator|nr:helix-turn-helix domain-containing protein [Bacteroidia bacterium]
MAILKYDPARPESAASCKSKLLAVSDALYVLSGKWKLQIIIALSHGHKRFKELQREVPGITARMLSKELRDMEMNQLVTRTVYNTVPVSVEYELTKYGLSLDKVIESLHHWGAKHRNKLKAARQ